jgi:hypothetical protein
VVSGGQTGADRAALDAAVACGVEYAGWCPAGGWAEDLTEPPGLLSVYPALSEARDPDPAVRTRWNVRDSTAVLVLHLGGADRSPGTRLTVEEARALGRPLLVARAGDADRIRAWLRSLRGDVVLDVAGPRESEEAGLHAAAYATLCSVLGERAG